MNLHLGYVILMNTDSESFMREINIDAYETTALKSVTDHVMMDHDFNPIVHLPFGPGKGFMVKRWKLCEVLQQVFPPHSSPLHSSPLHSLSSLPF